MSRQNNSARPPGQEQIFLDTRKASDYELFLKIKSLPHYSFQGHTALVPEEYLAALNLGETDLEVPDFHPEAFLFDYQSAVSCIAVRKRKFAVFMKCGLGKSLILLSYARYVSRLYPDRPVMIVSPLMVIRQTIGEAKRFFGEDYQIERIEAKNLQKWLNSGSGIGITNYEAIRADLVSGRLASIILDESSCLKSHYGAWGQRLIQLGKGLGWKLCLTGTPAPNDRIEYANHAVFLDQFPTVNSFLARYFVNRGQTGERWELKPHALRPFYRSLSHWCIFVENPATYGWRDNTDAIPPVHIHIHDVPLTDQQRQHVSSISGDLYGSPGGITSRSKLAQLARGRFNGEQVSTNKPGFIRDLIGTWQDRESTLVWCRFNREQDEIESALPGCGSIRGETKEAERTRQIEAFQRGEIRVLVSKPEVLGFGLNLQIATRQVFNGLNDSYEEFHQAVARSNRIGSTLPLNVHVPVTEIEKAMVDTVLQKAKRMQRDIEEQETIFKEVGYVA